MRIWGWDEREGLWRFEDGVRGKVCRFGAVMRGKVCEDLYWVDWWGDEKNPLWGFGTGLMQQWSTECLHEVNTFIIINCVHRFSCLIANNLNV